MGHFNILPARISAWNWQMSKSQILYEPMHLGWMVLLLQEYGNTMFPIAYISKKLLPKGVNNNNNYCTFAYTKSTPVGVYSINKMQPAKTQDTITHLYNPHCHKVPNLSAWWSEICDQGYKLHKNQTWKSSINCQLFVTSWTQTHNLRITVLMYYLCIVVDLYIMVIFCMQNERIGLSYD